MRHCYSIGLAMEMGSGNAWGWRCMLARRYVVNRIYRVLALVALWLIALAPASAAPAGAVNGTGIGVGNGNGKPMHDLVLRNGAIYDGSGRKPYVGDVAIDGDRISYVGARRDLAGRTDIDVKGQAIAPGFINMLAHPEDSLFADGRALSDLKQGVTLDRGKLRDRERHDGH
jgi:hypothetical protein